MFDLLAIRGCQKQIGEELACLGLAMQHEVDTPRVLEADLKRIARRAEEVLAERIALEVAEAARKRPADRKDAAPP